MCGREISEINQHSTTCRDYLKMFICIKILIHLCAKIGYMYIYKIILAQLLKKTEKSNYVLYSLSNFSINDTLKEMIDSRNSLVSRDMMDMACEHDAFLQWIVLSYRISGMCFTL